MPKKLVYARVKIWYTIPVTDNLTKKPTGGFKVPSML